MILRRPGGAISLFMVGPGGLLGARDIESPTTPGNLTVSARTATTLTLTWDASTDNVGVVAYEVRYRPHGHGHGPYVWWATTALLTATITGLTEVTGYDLRVRAIDAAGNQSGFATLTNELTADETAPTVPANLAASSITATGLTLTWDASTDNLAVTEYEVQQRLDSGVNGDYATIATVAAPTVTLAVTGLTATTGYRFRVRAKDAATNASAWGPDDTGLLATTPFAFNFVAPTVNTGTITVIIEDGTGGWYLGGSFTSITDSVATYTTGYTRLVRLRPDGTIDPGFSCPVNNIVRTMALDSTGLYIGGDFNGANSVGTSTRDRIARVRPFNDPAPGAVDAWNPRLNREVYALALDSANAKVYAGGFFNFIGGTNSDNPGGALHQSLARFSTGSTGTVDAYRADTDGVTNRIIYTLALDAANGKLYVGGSFTSLGNASSNFGTTPRRGIARLTTGATASCDAWRPDVQIPNSANEVRHIIYDDVNGKLYMCGDFVQVGGTGADFGLETRNRIARVTTATPSQLDGWNPNVTTAASTVRRMALDSANGFLYLGGDFTDVGGSTRRRIARVSSGATATLDAWDPDISITSGTAQVIDLLIYPIPNKAIIVGVFDAIANQVDTIGNSIAGLDI